MFDEQEKPRKAKILKKITKERLKNIALYYLQRFETSTENLRRVLQKRVSDYAYQNQDFDKSEAEIWIEGIVKDFESYGYVNDTRYAEMRIRDYLSSGKSLRFIKGKLREKGIDEDTVLSFLENQEYDEYEVALKLAKKKRIGPFRSDEASRQANRQKDMASMARAGFSYDVVQKISSMED